MKQIIFLDMDGVLADFSRGVATRFNFDCNQTNCSLGNLSESLKIEKKLLWKWVRENPYFWTNLNQMPDANYLWKNTSEAGFTTHILTAAPSSFEEGGVDFKEVARLKFDWIKKNFGMEDPARFICTTSKKKYLFMINKENTRNILIDDRSENIDDWNAHGGTGILHVNAKNSLKELDRHVKLWLD